MQGKDNPADVLSRLPVSKSQDHETQTTEEFAFPRIPRHRTQKGCGQVARCNETILKVVGIARLEGRD